MTLTKIQIPDDTRVAASIASRCGEVQHRWRFNPRENSSTARAGLKPIMVGMIMAAGLKLEAIDRKILLTIMFARMKLRTIDQKYSSYNNQPGKDDSCKRRC